MLAGVEPLGLVGLAIVPGALRYPLGVTRALAGPEDYEGATIGIRPSRIERATFEALGARARIYPAGSLSRLDGADLDLTTIATDHYELQARALTTNVAFWPRALIIVMNRKAFEALTPAQQSALRRAGRAAVAPHLAELRSDPQRWLVNVCPGSKLRLVVASAADRAALRRAVERVYDQLRRDPLTRELIAQIRLLPRDGPPTDRVRCGRVTPVAPPRTGPFDGRWRRGLTRKELIGQGASRPLADRLHGRWTAEFRRGRFEFHDRGTGAAARWSFVVHDNVVKFVFGAVEGGVGLESGRATEAQWSIYRHRLSFGAIPQRQSTIGLVGTRERAR
jgi:Bacterial extracellular solute-binding protein, family 7